MIFRPEYFLLDVIGNLIVARKQHNVSVEEEKVTPRDLVIHFGGAASEAIEAYT